MGFWQRLFSGGNVIYEQSYDGTDSYFVEGGLAGRDSYKNVEIAMNHPILTGAMLFISNLFAQARFEVRDKKTGELIPNNPFIKLLNNPNFFQTRIDFLEAAQFLKIAQGRVLIYLKRPIGFTEPTAMFVLLDSLVTWPDGIDMKPSMLSSREELSEVEIIYDKGNLNLKIKLGDLLILYDLPNVYSTSSIDSTNSFDGRDLRYSNSRLDGIRQTLVNTMDSLAAKNTILKTNGKEMLSRGGNGEVAFTPEQQAKAKRMFNTAYGPGRGRSRAFITSSNVTWQSMHVALRDLGLDESVKTDGNIIYTALHIPKDILSLEAKKTTYNNFKESMTSFIQNDITAMANDLAEAFWKEIGDDSIEIIATFEHLPVMQFAQMERYKAKDLQATALNNLLKTGIPQEEALVMVGLPSTLELNERQDLTGAPSTTTTTASTNSQSTQQSQGATTE
jgi:hypothetical protein